jgi:hypothetical protein
MMRSCCTPLLALLAAMALPTPAYATKVFILAGQSNATGNGFVPALNPGDAVVAQPQNSLYQYLTTDGETTEWAPLGPRWETQVNGYFGPELSFAQAMERRLGEPVAIIKVAFNGTTLDWKWKPSRNVLYPILVDKVLSALATFPGDYTLSGFLWVQGEGDANLLYEAEAYGDNLQALHAAITEDIGSMPFLYNQLHVNVARTFPEVVRENQASVQSANMWMVNIDDLSLGPDSVHFTTATHLELGRRFADMLLPSADFNNDGLVNGDDLPAWTASFGTARAGDGNSDGYSDGTDFLLWQRQLSNALSPPAAPVPEPSAWILVVLMAIAHSRSVFTHRMQMQ